MDTIIRGWIADILEQHTELLAIAIRQRAKFEGWLKFELAAHAQRNGATRVQVEASYASTTTDLCRSDLTFYFEEKRYDVELKTPNANWRLPGVLNTTRPITQNIAEIIQDGKKIARCAGEGIIAIVLFPVPSQTQQWTPYLQRIATGLNLSLSVQEHTTQITVPLGDGNTADVVICGFAVPPLCHIPARWLVRKIKMSDPEFAREVEELRPMMQEGDELWFYDEPAPLDVNAGELGVVLVRKGIPIQATLSGIH